MTECGLTVTALVGMTVQGFLIICMILGFVCMVGMSYNFITTGKFIRPREENEE